MAARANDADEQWEKDYEGCRLRRWDRFELQALLSLLLKGSKGDFSFSRTA